MFHPLTLFFTLLNTHIHLSSLGSLFLSCQNLSPPTLPRLFSLLFFYPLLLCSPCHVILSLSSYPLALSFLFLSEQGFLVQSNTYLLNMRGSNIQKLPREGPHRHVLCPPTALLLCLYECVLTAECLDLSCKPACVYIKQEFKYLQRNRHLQSESPELGPSVYLSDSCALNVL